MKRLYRRMRYGRPVIVVSGLPRSGTSMAMQMLAAGGLAVVTDGIRKPGEDNLVDNLKTLSMKALSVNSPYSDNTTGTALRWNG